MKKDDVININVNAKIKEEAAKILKEKGYSMTEAINLYLKEVIKCNGIPFDIVLTNSKVHSK